jgi:hypothetical protein
MVLNLLGVLMLKTNTEFAFLSEWLWPLPPLKVGATLRPQATPKGEVQAPDPFAQRIDRHPYSVCGGQYRHHREDLLLSVLEEGSTIVAFWAFVKTLRLGWRLLLYPDPCPSKMQNNMV